MALSSIPGSTLPYGANNDRLKKALAHRTTPQKPSLAHSPASISNHTCSSNYSRRLSDAFDDLNVDPHHASMATFSTISSTSSNGSTDSMLFSAIASQSTNTCSTDFMAPVVSSQYPSPSAVALGGSPNSDAGSGKPRNEAASFLDSNVPPIGFTPTEFNMQRMKLSEPFPSNSNTQKYDPSVMSSSCSVTSSSTSFSGSSRSEQNMDERLHHPNHLQVPTSVTYNSQFNRINGVNLLTSPSSSEYGKFGKIVEGSIHSASSFDSVDSFGRRISSQCPRRLFEKSKGTTFVANSNTSRSQSSNVSLNQSVYPPRQPPLSRNSSTSHVNSVRSSTHTLNKIDPEDSLHDAFNPNLYAESPSICSTRNQYSDPRIAYASGPGYKRIANSPSVYTQHSNMSVSSDNPSLSATTNTTCTLNSSHTLGTPTTRAFGNLDSITSYSKTASAKFNDPTDLSDAFMHLHTGTSAASVSTSIYESQYGAQSSENNNSRSNNDGAVSFTPSNLGRRGSCTSEGSSSPTGLTLDIDLDKVIHDAIVVSATHNTMAAKLSNPTLNHEDVYQNFHSSAKGDSSSAAGVGSYHNSQYYASEVKEIHNQFPSICDSESVSAKSVTNAHMKSPEDYVPDSHINHTTLSDHFQVEYLEGDLYALQSTSSSQLTGNLSNHKPKTFGKFGSSFKKLARKMAG